jgi:putative transposase
LGRQIAILTDKATLAGITVHLVNERGTSSTCPICTKKITKPRGRTMTCRHCGFTGHRDVSAAATIATRTPGGASIPNGSVVLPQVITHRRAGRHLPGAGQSRRDPRRPIRGPAKGSVGQRWPAPPPVGSRSTAPAGEDPQHPPPTR